jgi:hypothetical protein
MKLGGFLMLTIASGVAVGCAAFREPAVGAVPRDQTLHLDVLSEIHVAIREPLLGDPIPQRYQSPSGDPGWEAELALELRERDAGLALEALSETNVFADVSMGNAQDSSRVVTVVVEPPEIGGCHDEFWGMAVTLGVIPAWCTGDVGVFLSFPRHANLSFACSWPQEYLLGSIPVPIAWMFGWTTKPDRVAYIQNLRQCIDDARETFLAAAQ